MAQGGPHTEMTHLCQHLFTVVGRQNILGRTGCRCAGHWSHQRVCGAGGSLRLSITSILLWDPHSRHVLQFKRTVKLTSLDTSLPSQTATQALKSLCSPSPGAMGPGQQEDALAEPLLDTRGVSGAFPHHQPRSCPGKPPFQKDTES